MLQITTTGTQYKTAEIDGVYFEVRQLGSGEQLALTQMMRYKNKFAGDSKDLSEEDTQELVNAITRMFEIYKNCFKDKNGGKDVDNLFDRVPFEDLGKIIDQVFNAGTTEKTV